MPEGRDRIPTPSQTVGPFFGFALPFTGDADATAGAASASSRAASVRIAGQVFDGAGAAVPDAILEVWHGDAFARCATDAEGRYRVSVPKPGATPGPNGSTQAAHLEVNVFARGLLRHLATRIYFPDEAAANAADPLLADIDPARRDTLVARRDGEHLRFDIHLQGAGETVFFAL
jgi:protocatechuate 3,4-dioxygenase alpha subunit